MAIIANRSRTSSRLLQLAKFSVLLLRHLSIAIFITTSLYLLYFADSKSLTNSLLELTGSSISKSEVLYKQIFRLINGTVNQFAYLSDINSENERLKLEIARLYAQQSDIESIHIENLALRKLLSVVNDVEYSYTTAKLLSVSVTPFNKIAVIAAGRNQGIVSDQIVTDGKWLIGRVADISENYATVILLSDAESRVPVITKNSRERGILAWDDGKLSIVYLQDNHLVQEGEIVMTSGDGAMYPLGIGVARVSSVKQGKVHLEQVANLYNTDFVTIIGK